MTRRKRVGGMGLPQYKEVGWTDNTLDSLVNMLYKKINGSKRRPKKIEIKIVEGRVEIYVDGKKLGYNSNYIIKIKDFKAYKVISIKIAVNTLQLHHGKITKKSIKERIENIIKEFEREESIKNRDSYLKTAGLNVNELYKDLVRKNNQDIKNSRNTNNDREKEDEGYDFGR